MPAEGRSVTKAQAIAALGSLNRSTFVVSSRYGPSSAFGSCLHVRVRHQSGEAAQFRSQDVGVHAERHCCMCALVPWQDSFRGCLTCGRGDYVQGRRPSGSGGLLRVGDEVGERNESTIACRESEIRGWLIRQTETLTKPQGTMVYALIGRNVYPWEKGPQRGVPRAVDSISRTYG